MPTARFCASLNLKSRTLSQPNARQKRVTLGWLTPARSASSAMLAWPAAKGGTFETACVLYLDALDRYEGGCNVQQRAAQGRASVLQSPVVHTPQVGKAITARYLAAAFHVFFNESFRYVREIVGPQDAALEFQVEIDGIAVNGVDLIEWNAAGRIVEFKVLIRPLKAINLIQQKMAAMLQKS